MANTYQVIGANQVSSTDAQFRTLAQQLENALLASGFLEVAPDTGQLTLASATRPSTLGTYAGYRIYRAKDSLAASKPLYLKVEYGTGASATSTLGIRYTIGQGSDGAGNLTGFTAGPTALQPTATPTTGTVVGGGGPAAAAIAIRSDNSGSNTDMVFIFGRMVSPDTGLGSALGAFLFAENITPGSAATPTWLYTDHTIAWTTIASMYNQMFPDMTSFPHSGGTTSKVLATKGQVVRNGEYLDFPFLAGKPTEFVTTTDPDAVKFSAVAWGSSRVWLPLRGSFVNTGVLTPVIRWD